MGEEEVTLTFGTKEVFEKDGDYIKGLKFFNFGEDTVINIKSITYYMDGRKEKQDDFVASKISAPITIDGVAGADEPWADAKEYNFVSMVALDGGVAPTDTSATAKLMYDKDNMYVFVNVIDSSIDMTNENNFERDGLEILFDEDNCKKEGANSSNWGDTNKDGFHYRATGLDAKSAEKSNLTPATSAIQGGGTDGAKVTGIEVKYALTDKGYTMEAKIPFAAQKAGGESVGLDLIVQDCKGGVRYNEIYLTATEDAKVYWNNTSAAFGTVILEKSDVPDIEEPSPSPNPGEETEEPSPSPNPGEETEEPSPSPTPGEEVTEPTPSPNPGEEATDPSEGGEVKDPSEGGEVKDPSEGGEVKDPSESGEVKDPSEGGEVKDPSEGGEVKDPSESGEVKDPSEENESEDSSGSGGTPPSEG